MLSWLGNRNTNETRNGPRIENRNEIQQQQPPNQENQRSFNPTGNSNQNHMEDSNNENDISASLQQSNQQIQSAIPRQEPSDKVGAGIIIRTLKPGDATNYPKKGDTCRIHYEGFVLLDPTGKSEEREKIDSSVEREEPFIFRLFDNQVLEGLDMGVQKMSLGQKAEIIIPSLYAYGDKGYLPLVPPKATLVFEVEMISFTTL